jgi:hypothetical protein
MRRGVLVMAVAALLAGCSREPASVKVDPALAALVPADAVMVAGVRMEAVRSTPFYQKWVGRRQVVDLDKFASETGIDPRQDIGELLFASDGKIGIVFAKGRFPESTLRRPPSRRGRPRHCAPSWNAGAADFPPSSGRSSRQSLPTRRSGSHRSDSARWRRNCPRRGTWPICAVSWPL